MIPIDIQVLGHVSLPHLVQWVAKEIFAPEAF